MCDEALLELYLEQGTVSSDRIGEAVKERKVFPCYFGSALKMQGIDELLKGLEKYARCPVYGREFGARVYKISRDAQGNRLTHMKITGGILKVKTLLETGEKVDQIRIYSGTGYEGVGQAKAVIFFIIVAVIALLQLNLTRRKEVES